VRRNASPNFILAISTLHPVGIHIYLQIGMTKNLQDLVKGMQKHNQSMQRSFGVAPFQEMAAVIKKHNRSQFNLSGISGLADIAKSISQQMKPLNATSTLLGSSIQAQIAAINNSKTQSALFGLTSSLAELAKTNQFASERLLGFAASQLTLSNNLAAIAKTLAQSHLNSFNSIDIALQGLSKTYLKNIAITGNWEDIYVAEEANASISNISDELLNNTSHVSVQDLDNFRQSIVTELFALLVKTRTDKARKLIIDILAVVSFLLTLYNPLDVSTDKTNTDIIELAKREIDQINTDYSAKIETELQRFNKTRTATARVKLRYSEKKNSRVIGLVEVGQQVTVIEIRHKHLLISYLDVMTREPKSGFVSKKYFPVDK
jgi:uncharacterized protein YgiM (DUF1202 family)